MRPTIRGFGPEAARSRRASLPTLRSMSFTASFTHVMGSGTPRTQAVTSFPPIETVISATRRRLRRMNRVAAATRVLPR